MSSSYLLKGVYKEEATALTQVPLTNPVFLPKYTPAVYTAGPEYQHANDILEKRLKAELKRPGSSVGPFAEGQTEYAYTT